MTDQLDADEKEAWREADEMFPCTMLAESHRRDRGEVAHTEKDVTAAKEALQALIQKQCRPEKFVGDLSGQAPPVVIDDLAQQAGAEDEEMLAISAATPTVDPLAMATDTQLRLGAPWALIGSDAERPTVHKSLVSVEGRLSRSRLSRTEYPDTEEFSRLVLPHSLVITRRQIGSTRVVLLMGVYAQYGVTCELTRHSSDNQWQLASYVFTCRTLRHA